VEPHANGVLRRIALYRLMRRDIGICFQDVGRGAPPLLLIHDLGSASSSFAPQIQRFRRRHRVVAIDLRGHGASDGARSEYSVADLADDVAWLSYELGLYAPVVVGRGLGGMIGVELAARYPELPGAVVALEASPEATGHPAGRARPGILAWDGAATAQACRVPVLYLDARSEATELSRTVKEWSRAITHSAETGCFTQLPSPEGVKGTVDLLLAQYRRGA
jgi:pimeloyl-ACP methyl ester carboxylesterase